MPYAPGNSRIYRAWYVQQRRRERDVVGGLGATAAPEFILQMQTTTSAETITLPMTGNVAVDIDWGDGTVETVTTDSPSHEFATAGTYDIKTTGSVDSFSFNDGGDKNKLLNVLNGGTDFATGSLVGGFRGCANLVTADFSGFDTSGLDNFTFTFRGCSSLTSIDLSGFDTSRVTTFSSTFRDCSSLTSIDLSGFDTSSAANLSNMFRGCSSLTSIDLSGFDTSSATNINSMLLDCSGLTSDPGIVNFNVTAILQADNFASGANAMLSEPEYNAILVAWEAQAVNDSISVNFGDAVYSGAGATARAALIADHAWTITDGGAA